MMFTEDEKKAFYRVIMSRRSVRSYRDQEIPREVLERILETGRRAASAANRQPWRFVVAARSQEHPIYGLLAGRTLQQAPVIIIGLVDRSRAWVRKGDGMSYGWVDVTIALTEMILAATAEGLGTCWVAAFDSAEASRILELPEELAPVALVTLGYPLESLGVDEKDRLPFSEVVDWGSLPQE
jgi:nitroreductase